MTKRQAMKRVLAGAAIELESHIGNGSEWLTRDDDDNELSDADAERMKWAVRVVADGLRRRSDRASA